MPYKYKNKSGQEQVLIGFGVVQAEEVIESASAIENPNFEFVGEVQQNMVVGTEPAQPNAIIEATQTDNQTEENQ